MSHTFCCINLQAQEQHAQEQPAGCLCTGIAQLELYLLLEQKTQGLVVHLPAGCSCVAVFLSRISWSPIGLKLPIHCAGQSDARAAPGFDC